METIIPTLWLWTKTLLMFALFVLVFAAVIVVTFHIVLSVIDAIRSGIRNERDCKRFEIALRKKKEEDNTNGD